MGGRRGGVGGRHGGVGSRAAEWGRPGVGRVGEANIWRHTMNIRCWTIQEEGAERESRGRVGEVGSMESGRSKYLEAHDEYIATGLYRWN